MLYCFLQYNTGKSDVKEIHHAHGIVFVVLVGMRQHVVERIYCKKRRNWYEAVVFAEVAPFEQFVEAEVEILPRSIVLGNDFFEFAVLAAVVVHFVNELRIFNVVLILGNELFDEVQFAQMMNFIADKEK